MSKMPGDRNRRHEELLRRVGIPMPGRTETPPEQKSRAEQEAHDPLRSLLPPEIPSPFKPKKFPAER